MTSAALSTTTLLSISRAIATIRTRKELFATIIDTIKPSIPVDDTGIMILNRTGEEWQDWTNVDNYQETKAVTQLQQMGYDQYFPVDRWMQYVLHHSGIMTVAQFQEQYPEHPFGPVMWEAGLREFIFTPLLNRGQRLGVLFFDAKQEGTYTEQHLELFKAIADLLAVAVANILTNEEILQREREKAVLLSISKAVATIRDKQNLLEVIIAKIKPLFNFHDCGLFVFDPGRQHLEDLAVSFPSLSPSEANRELANANAAIFPYPGSVFEPIFERLRATNEPIIHNYKTDIIAGWADYVQAPVLDQIGYAESMFCLLKTGGEEIGAFAINSLTEGHFRPSHFTLFQNVADQLSTAVANILANEELLDREAGKVLQLAVSNALADGQDWDQKLLAMVQTIQSHVPFDYVVAGLETGGQIRHGYGFYRTGSDEYQTLLADDFLRLARLSAEQYTQMRQQVDDTRPLLLTGEAFEQHCRQYALKRAISETFRLQSHALLPISLTREGRFTLAFYSRQADTYRPYHLDLLQKLRPTLALALDRLLAYEEVAKLSQQLQQENTYLQEEVRLNYRFEEIVGTSQAVRDVFEKVGKVGPMNSTVLILGETGTGKELVARAIHQASPRQAKALIKINCAALPAQLIESELFGHEKGAFTGAIERRIGKFELAHESTIFLDEIGELPLELQAKLLRAIQEKEIERLGSNKVIQTDVRVLAATNRNLEKEVAEGRFRSDLYFRLNVYPIKLPPLRERKEDIPLLAIHFSQKLSKKLGKTISGLSNGAIKEMQAYHWPGNIRELEHVIERAAIETQGGTIKNLGLLKRPEGELTVIINPAFQLKSYADAERELIMNTLRYCSGRIRGTGGAAQILKVKATTLEARMKKLGIKREFFIHEGANAGGVGQAE